MTPRLFLLLAALSLSVQAEEAPQVFTPFHPKTSADTAVEIPPSVEEEPSLPETEKNTPAAEPAKAHPAADLLILQKVTELQETLAYHLGKLEDIQHQLDVLKGSVDALKVQQTDYFAKATLPAPAEKQATAPNAQMSTDATTPAEKQKAPTAEPSKEPEQPAVDLSPEDLYKESRALIVQGNYPKAREQLELFIEKNPQHELTTAAYYWLAETFFAEKKYAEASKKFLSGYQHDPKSNKAPDMLLKLGLSLSNIKKKAEACKTFKKLKNDFADLSASHKKILEREETKLNCGE